MNNNDANNDIIPAIVRRAANENDPYQFDIAILMDVLPDMERICQRTKWWRQNKYTIKDLVGRYLNMKHGKYKSSDRESVIRRMKTNLTQENTPKRIKDRKDRLRRSLNL